MDFVVGDVVRQGFGFANPNHAAAAICALFPFCWGWRGRWRWVGRIAGVALCVMLAMTYSRTGVLVLVCEIVALLLDHKTLSSGMIGRVERVEPCRTSTWLNKVQGRGCLATAVVAVAIAVWWMWPRMTFDGAIVNRPKIWLSGFRLFAANPLGIGFGKSGEIASALMLPDGITVRSLVNSHLTLLAEMGAVVGGAWFTFVVSSLCSTRRMWRTWVAFAGLAVSAFSSSVFDWHVLFDFKEMGGYGAVNFALAWGLFVAFVVMEVAMISVGVFGNNINNLGQHVMERGLTSPRKVVVRAEMVCASVLVALVSSVLLARRDATPKVERGYVAVGNGGPCVYRSEGWSLKSVAKLFPDGARFCIRPGVPTNAEDAGEVWLFGDVAESSHRFPCSNVTVVDPPEFYEPEKNVTVK